MGMEDGRVPSPELRPSTHIQPSVEQSALEDPMIVIISDRNMAHPEKVTNVSMRAGRVGRVVRVWETIEPTEVVDDKEEK